MSRIPVASFALSIAAVSVTVVVLTGAGDPPAHKAVAVPLASNPRIAHVSAAAELPDGRVVLTDAKTPAVWLLNPTTGTVVPLGTTGAGPEQWIQPGGLYGGKDGALLLLDRAPLRVMVIAPDGHFDRTYSISIRGTTGSSDADADAQELDASGFSYFPDRQAAFRRAQGQKVTAFGLVRFDPAKQTRTEVASLTQPDSRTVVNGNMTLTTTVIGSPADGWGVTPDGRIAIVRGDPYRVDWIGADGKVTRGPDLPHDVLPMTDADKQAAKAAAAKAPSLSIGQVGENGSAPTFDRLFAATKAPFKPDDVIVSADAQVWVMRSRALASTGVTYDVLGGDGQRIDRIEMPDGSRVVGFGKGVVYVRGVDAAGQEILTRIKRK